MKKSKYTLTLTFLVVLVALGLAQNQSYQQQIVLLEKQKGRITAQEKDALRLEVQTINDRLERGEIDKGEAQNLKEIAARKRAKNIENRLAIINNKIALLERNQNGGLDSLNTNYDLDKDYVDNEKITFLGIAVKEKSRHSRYDRLTRSDLVIAFGLNNAITDGEPFAETRFQFLRSRFFEIGYAWNTRIVKSDWLRIKYGFSFQFNGLRTNNEVFIQDANNFGSVSLGNALDVFSGGLDIRKVKLRMDSFIFPVHLEFGPSEKETYGELTRYSRYNKFKIGIGGFFGFNYNNIQKLRDANRIGSMVDGRVFTADNIQLFPNGRGIGPFSGTSDRQTIFGLSTYVGQDDFSIYLKYQITQIFKEPSVKRNNISLGLRFDL